MKKIVTHPTPKFHADDVFAVAVFHILNNGQIEIIRTVDEEIINTADVVVDIGKVYDPEKNRFDHHQRDGAGERENGIQYASAGLVWKHYGEKIAGSKEVAEYIDKKLIQFIDAIDNGQNVYEQKIPDVLPYTIHDIINLHRDPEADEVGSLERFKKAVEFAVFIINREVELADKHEKAKIQAIEKYNLAEDKRIIMFDDENFSSSMRIDALFDFPEPIFIIYPDSGRGTWRLQGVKKNKFGFEKRKNLPESWGGLSNEELQKVSGISEATFCHRALFTGAAINKEGAIKMALKALE